MQFTLQTMLLVFLVVASSLGAFGSAGLLVAGVLLAIGVFIHNAELGWPVGIAVMLMWLLLLTVYTGGAFRGAGRVGPYFHARECHKRMRSLGLALREYASTHQGHLPLARGAYGDGKPEHSWRCRILRQIGRGDLHTAYDIHEPWDGSENAPLVNPRPREYACRDDCRACPWTNFVAVTGSGTAWPDSKGGSMSQFPDGPENTIVVVEIRNSDIAWTEPRDLNVEELAENLDAKATNSLVTVHRLDQGYFSHKEVHRICVCTADARPHVLRADISLDTLRALMTPSGGEDVSVDDPRLYDRTVVTRIHWDRVVAVFVLVVSTAVLLFRPWGKQGEDS